MSNTSAREALREQRAREAQAARRRRLIAISSLVLAVVLAAVAIFAYMGKQKRNDDAKVSASGTTLSAALVKIPASNYDAVGIGSVTYKPEPIPGGKPDLVNGKPRILYIGAEFCPFCAMDRLSLVSALSRFGTFTGLEDALSSPTENEPTLRNIPTVTFRNAEFTSDLVSLTAVETSDRMGQPLKEPTAEDSAILLKHSPKGNIPFVHYGTAFANSAPFDGTFMSGQQPADIAKQLEDPNSQTSKAVLGGANEITAQICELTGNKPANVCTSPGVVAAAKALK